eukprot:TRINITY_DN46877_c0_g1_i1.p1 TRINITY_DN46877_c0_g1~~TRINITY_DN46877_c0_g1_i1.p1  ORF type:complete len:749 (+),score=239.42 TRINITY_DN46877_c0_g1_i1:75-2249(+)
MAGAGVTRDSMVQEGVTPGEGGTAGILSAEREKTSFRVEDMMQFLDGGRKNTAKRRWIYNSHKDAETFVHEEKPREELVSKSLTHFMDIHWPHLSRGYKPVGGDMSSMSDARMLTGPLSLHYGVFMSTLRSQSSDEQQKKWLPLANRLAFIGCYAQTELSHGSNVRGIRTTATYDPAAQEWIINTPELGATKWWSTGLYSATHAAVYAQMILPGGKHMGVHVYLVQLRDARTLKPLPGVEVGEVGARMGENDKTIGYARFDHVRVQRDHLMQRRQYVEPDGTYVKRGAKPGAGKGKPADKPKKGGDKLHYISMLKTRVALTSTAGGSLAQACTIAARYSCVRRQGFADTRAGQSHLAPERQIIDYSVQRYRVLRRTAEAYAIKLSARWLLSRRKQIEKSDDPGADLPELHATAAGLKAIATVTAADGIEDLRRACGGHGYLLNSGIAALEGEYKGPNTTAEGDFVVLLLQTARFLVRAVADARAGKPLAGLTAAYAPLAQQGFDPARDARPKQGAYTRADWSDPSFLVKLFAQRSLVSSLAAADALEGRKRDGDSFDVAWNSCARQLYATAQSHCLYFVLAKFAEEVAACEDAACRATLTKLCCIFGLSNVLQGEQWLGLLSQGDAAEADRCLADLSQQLRNDVVGLTDAFDIPDRVLNSTLGRSDGNVYEALYVAAKRSPLNRRPDGTTIAVPSFFDSVTKYLDGAAWAEASLENARRPTPKL